jgi:hypothetical protein
MAKKDIERNYREFWKNIVEVRGKPSMTRIKAELSDYRFLLQNVPIVYSELVGLGYPNYPAHVILQEHGERYLNKETTQEDVADMINGCTDLEKLKNELRKYFDLLKPTSNNN